MSWGAVKPVLADIELYSSLLVNVYAILFALTYSLRWLIGRARKVTLPPGEVLSSALSDAFSIIVLLGLVIATAVALIALFGDAGLQGWSLIENWLEALLARL